MADFDPPEDTEFERPQQGIHYTKLEVSGLASRELRFILRGINRAQLLAFLTRYPLALIALKPRLHDIGGYYSGGYNERRRSIVLSLERPEVTYAQPFQPGMLETISAAAPTQLEAVQRSLVHELGHHMIAMQREKLAGFLREAFIERKTHISKRAGVNWREYFCETHAAYAYHRKSLRHFDPQGYAIVERVRKLLEVNDGNSS